MSIPSRPSDPMTADHGGPRPPLPAPLPVVPTRAAPATPTQAALAEAACRVDDEGCITCGDVALPLTVVEVLGSDARCRDDAGREELVAIDLVGEVAVGDLLLVHAGVALEQLDPRHDGLARHRSGNATDPVTS